jgi:hypothetical protein
MKTEAMADPMVAIALIGASEEDLERRGIHLTEPGAVWDEPGPIRATVVRVGADKKAALVLHVGHPEYGIEVRADPGTSPDAVLRWLLHELDLPDADLAWVAHT